MTEKEEYHDLSREFMLVFKKENVPKEIRIPDKGTLKLRFNLIVEELFELAVASDSVEEFNLVMQEYERRSYSASSYPMDNNIRVLESLDALCDLQYVTSGGIVDFGFNEIFREAFEEVHRSNMSKMCINEEEALRTVEYYKQKGTESYVKKVDRYWVVYRIADDKVLKSIHYSPANLERVLISYKVRKKL